MNNVSILSDCCPSHCKKSDSGNVLDEFIRLLKEESVKIEKKYCTWGNHHNYTHGY